MWDRFHPLANGRGPLDRYFRIGLAKNRPLANMDILTQAPVIFLHCKKIAPFN